MFPLAGTVIVDVIVPEFGILIGTFAEIYSLQFDVVKLNSEVQGEVVQLFV